MNIDALKVKPLRDDVLLRHVPTHNAMSSTIYYKENVDASALQFFEVVAVGPEVKLLAVGDRVVLSWKRVTEPMRFDYDGRVQQFGITSEKEVDAIVEQ